MAKRLHATTLLRVVVYGYVAAVVCLWLMIRFCGDRWWFATLLQYGPRWIYAAPLTAFVPAALAFQRRMLLPLGIALLVALFGLMGLTIPWRNLAGSSNADLRVMSYNIQRYSVSGEKFSQLIDQERPDLIAVQECAGIGKWTDWWKRNTEWYTIHRGELLIASKYPIKHVEYSFSTWPKNRKPVLNAIYCVVAAPQGDIGFCNVHLDTPRRALSAVLDRESIVNLNNIDYAQFRLECRENESKDLAQWLDNLPNSKVVAGDFNMTSDSPVFRRDWKSRRDAFRWAGFGFGTTKQTVIRRRGYGSRIDYVFAGSDRKPIECWVGADMGSDHLPLLADLKSAD